MARKTASRKPVTRKAAKKASRAPGRNGASKQASQASTLGGRPMQTLTGQLVVDGAAKAITWYARAFGAKELGERKLLPDGRVLHAVLQIGDSPVMISDSFGGAPPPKELSGAFLHIQNKDIQKMWDRAMADGAKPILPLANQFWGDKYGQLRDPFGQMWSLGWPANLTAAQKAKMEREAMAAMTAPASP